MSADKLFTHLNLSKKDINQLKTTIKKFKKTNKDYSLSDEDIAMDIIVAYYGATIQNLASYGAVISYNTVVNQWKKKYEKPADFQFVSSNDKSYITKNLISYMCSIINRYKDYDALSYFLITQKLLLSNSKVTRKMIRDQLHISEYKQNKILERLRGYYGRARINTSN